MSESVRHRLDVATAMAWEALADAHVAQALEFISLFEDRLPLEEALTRYLQEMDMGDTMASTVRTKVLVTLEDEGKTPDAPLPMLTSDNGAQDVASPEDDEGWRRFRPDTVMRGVFERQRRREEVERLIELAIARAEEAIIQTHVDNAITFAALLEDSGALSRGVEHYLDALGVMGGRGQSIAQRTMARLADVHLPRKA